MVQIHSITEDTCKDYIKMQIPDGDIDFSMAKQAAKEKAMEYCDHPMILSWKNGRTGQTHPDYECGVNKRPFWIRYAEGRGANLTVDINGGDFVFMILKI